LLLPRDDSPDKNWQSNLAEGVWLFTTLTIITVLGDDFHTSNVAIRILCGQLHSPSGYIGYGLLMSSSLIPIYIRRYRLRLQKRKLTAAPATP
jgi:hypothetical protein